MMFSRRHVLKGAGGILVALPTLEAFVPRFARAETTEPPKRFIAIYHPNGVYTPQWFPTPGDRESDFVLGPIHAPLKRFKSKLLLTNGIAMSVALSGPGGPHQRGAGAFLTGRKLESGNFVGNDGSRAGYASGISIDQHLAAHIGKDTPISSLQLGIHTLTANVVGVVSYTGPHAPLLPQNDPRLTFRTLFLNSNLPEKQLDEVSARRKSILDTVQQQLAALKRHVSTNDRVRLDQHLTLLRDLERRLVGFTSTTCHTPDDPKVVDYKAEMAMPLVSKLQLDLLLLAFRCDLTRVATIMYSDALNHIAMPFLCDAKTPPTCVKGDVHNITHYADSNPLREQVSWRDRWVAEQIAYILSGLESITEANGSNALDNSLLLWGSEVARGNVHAHDDMPFLLAGGGANFRMNRYVRWNDKPSHNDLLTTISHGFGNSIKEFGDPEFCNGPLSNLT